MSLHLYYWPLPYRAQALRFLMADQGLEWIEHRFEEVLALKNSGPEAAVPMMAPPALQHGGTWISQAPAIALYLGDISGTLPKDPSARAWHLKVFCDAMDVMDELTCNCGQEMWTRDAWSDFTAHRWPRWGAVFERGAVGLNADAPGLADYASAALWSAVTYAFPNLALPAIPNTLAQAQAVAARPAIAALLAEQRSHWGNTYCGGQIEASLREMIEKG